MANISRRYFMFGAMLTGAAPRPSISFAQGVGLSIAQRKTEHRGYRRRRATLRRRSPMPERKHRRAGRRGFGPRRAGRSRRWRKPTKYTDFRKMLDKEAKNIDAVVIATPDHMHATAALWPACSWASTSMSKSR